MKKFKLHIVREAKEASEGVKAVERDERDVEINANTCCGAILLANRQRPDYLVTSWKEVIEENLKEQPKHVKLDKTSFKSEAEWQSAQMDMDTMSFEDGLALAEKRNWKVIH